MIDALGDRMKAYEEREAGRRFLPMLPVYARIDGRNFSSFTRGMGRPFDPLMSEAMIRTTEALIEETYARIGYTQSDEISLVWVADRHDSLIFFDHRIAKMTSVLASFATAAFTATILSSALSDYANKLPHFDCRVFQLPNRTEAVNVFLWREQDATKNAINMAARAYYSQEELDHRNGSEMQEMLFAKGVNFNDYPIFFKRGVFVRRETVSVIRRLEMPRFSSVINREAVIFDSAEPEVEN